MKISIWLVAAVIGLGANFAAASETVVVDRSMSEQEVLDAQQGWCKALLDIGNVHAKEGHAAAKALAGEVIDGAYAYQMGTVLFKPTLTVNPQTFRTTRDGALFLFCRRRFDPFPLTMVLLSRAGRSARSKTRPSSLRAIAQRPWGKCILPTRTETRPRSTRPGFSSRTTWARRESPPTIRRWNISPRKLDEAARAGPTTGLRGYNPLTRFWARRARAR